MQAVRIIGMVLAAAGILYAIEYVPAGRGAWFWALLLAVGFAGLLGSFRAARRSKR